MNRDEHYTQLWNRLAECQRQSSRLQQRIRELEQRITELETALKASSAELGQDKEEIQAKTRMIAQLEAHDAAVLPLYERITELENGIRTYVGDALGCELSALLDKDNG